MTKVLISRQYLEVKGETLCAYTLSISDTHGEISMGFEPSERVDDEQCVLFVCGLEEPVAIPVSAFESLLSGEVDTVAIKTGDMEMQMQRVNKKIEIYLSVGSNDTKHVFDYDEEFRIGIMNMISYYPYVN